MLNEYKTISEKAILLNQFIHNCYDLVNLIYIVALFFPHRTFVNSVSALEKKRETSRERELCYLNEGNRII